MVQLVHVKKNLLFNNADGIMASMGGNGIWFVPQGQQMN